MSNLHTLFYRSWLTLVLQYKVRCTLRLPKDCIARTLSAYLDKYSPINHYILITVWLTNDK
jgi:hypothetical protein